MLGAGGHPSAVSPEPCREAQDQAHQGGTEDGMKYSFFGYYLCCVD